MDRFWAFESLQGLVEKEENNHFIRGKDKIEECLLP